MKKLFIALAVLLVFSHCQATDQLPKKDLLDPNESSGSTDHNSTDSTVDGSGGGTSGGGTSGGGTSGNTSETNTTGDANSTDTVDGTSTSTGINKKAAIIGASVTGGALLLAGGITAAVLLAKRNQRRKTKDPRPILAASTRKKKTKPLQFSHHGTEELSQNRVLKSINGHHSSNHPNRNVAKAEGQVPFKNHKNQIRRGDESNSKELHSFQ